VRDDSRELQKLAAEVIKADFPHLQHMRLLYGWRTPARLNRTTGRFVHGEARKLSARERDLFGFDGAVIMAKDLWKDMGPRARLRLMWHELYHFDLFLDEAQLPIKDDHGRIRYKLRLHDLEVPRFEEEIRKFGPASDERAALKRIARLYRQTKGRIAGSAVEGRPKKKRKRVKRGR